MDELRRISALITASQEQMCARLTAEVQQVHAEILQVQSGQAKVCAEMEKKVDALALSEAQFRASQEQICTRLTAEVQQVRAEVKHVQTSQAKVCAELHAKLEQMQNEEEKKKGNEEECLRALVRARARRGVRTAAGGKGGRQAAGESAAERGRKARGA